MASSIVREMSTELSEEALMAIVDGVTANSERPCQNWQRARQGAGRVVNPALQTRRRGTTAATPELR